MLIVYRVSMSGTEYKVKSIGGGSCLNQCRSIVDVAGGEDKGVPWTKYSETGHLGGDGPSRGMTQVDAAV